MKTQGKIWIIYNAETKAQSKPMSIVQAQVAILSLVNKDHSNFFLWTPGWENWIPVKDFLASEQSYFVIAQPPHPGEPAHEQTMTVTQNTRSSISNSPYTQVVIEELPKKEEELGWYHQQDFNGHELDLNKIQKSKSRPPKIKTGKAPNVASLKGSDRRRDPRHNFKIEVVLITKTSSFRTYSRDISLSGTMLEHEIPRDFLNKPFDLIIVNPFESNPKKARLHFRSKIVGDMSNPRRLTFIEQDPAMTQSLDALLKAYVAYQSQIRNNAG